MQSKEGHEGYYNLKCHLMRNEAGKLTRMLVRCWELDPEEVYRIQLAQAITNDKNPKFFLQSAKALSDAHPDAKYALVQFDVAKFKVINEQYGEAFGDELLEYFVNTLKLLCGEEQVYTRLTADVFMILTTYDTRESLLEFIEDVRHTLSGYRGASYRLVFGVCLVDRVEQNLRKYGDCAAFARQSIKNDVLQHVAFYNEEMKKEVRFSKFVEDNMERALERREFVMYLQPKYSISKGNMIGAEALVRWIHPEKGIIPPMEFVPIFEQNGFIIVMDQYIWEEACKEIRKWMDEGLKPIPISVNVSRRHLRTPNFIQALNNLVQKYRISKEYLEIEITETIEDEDVQNGVMLLKENGYRLLMDDFGSGYSSLNMLKDTQFDVIKMDRGFLQNFIGSERGRKIVEHTVQMTNAIGLDMIAEGVETEEQAEFLEDCGCDKAQGFFYAKPMPIAEFDKIFREQS
jgi:EAL domain-containing protein (putative c-di-GMP-specific phosphodiesterase class I)/GGDEF domain-containing protein